MLLEIHNELFRLQATGLELESDSDLVRVTLPRKSCSVSVAALLKILQPLPDAAGAIFVKRAINRSMIEGIAFECSPGPDRSLPGKSKMHAAIVDAHIGGAPLLGTLSKGRATMAIKRNGEREAMERRLIEVTEELNGLPSQQIPIHEKAEKLKELCGERERLKATR
jgi:hypothetical protein